MSNQASVGMHQPLDGHHMEHFHPILEVALRWEFFDVATKKSYLEVNVNDLIEHSSTCYPDSKPLLEMGVHEDMDENLNVWYCYRCHKSFSIKDDFAFHDNLHLEDYFYAQEIALPEFWRTTRNMILDSKWQPLNPLGTSVSDHFEAQRASLLKDIKWALELMIATGSLCNTHIDPIKILVEMAFGDSDEMIEYLKIADLHFAICCLDVESLALIVNLLTCLVAASGQSEVLQVSPPIVSRADEPPKIYLNADKTKFLVDLRPFTKKKITKEEKGTVNAVDALKLAHWLCGDYPYKVRREYWDVWRNKLKSHVEGLYPDIDRGLERLRSGCKLKFKLLEVERLCDEVPKLEPGHAEALFQRREEIERAQGETDQSSAITDLLMEADKLHARSKSEVEDYFSASYSDITDELVQQATETLWQRTAGQLMAVEAYLGTALYEVEEITSNIRTSSKLNFRFVVMPLVNSFMKARMQEHISSQVPPQGPSEAEAEAGEESRRKSSQAAECSTSNQTSQRRRRGRGRGSGGS